jgi:hypothetical protein
MWVGGWEKFFTIFLFAAVDVTAVWRGVTIHTYTRGAAVLAGNFLFSPAFPERKDDIYCAALQD